MLTLGAFKLLTHHLSIATYLVQFNIITLKLAKDTEPENHYALTLHITDTGL